jgi:Fic family protein
MAIFSTSDKHRKRDKMSTKERYGTEVWQAVITLSFSDGKNMHPLLSVGDVAAMAGVSRDTAKKYLMELVKKECVATFPVGKRWVYQCVFEGFKS